MKSDFVDEMNLFAKENGLENSNFINPSGLYEGKNFSHMSSFDVCKLLDMCYNYNEMLELCKNKECDIKIKRGNSIISIHIDSTTKYDTNLINYNVLLIKTGSGNGNENLACLFMYKKQLISCCILGADGNAKKFGYMKKLIDRTISIIDNRVSGKFELDSCKSYCSFLIKEKKVLLEKDKDEQLPSMSLNKLLTCLLVLKNVNNLEETLVITNDDLDNTKNTSGCLFEVNDIVSIKDLLLALMMPSSNQAANALANKIIINKK